MFTEIDAAVQSCAPSGGDDRVGSLVAALPPEDDVFELATVFGLLADPGRVRLLITLLEGGEVCVHDLAVIVGQSESGVSHALRLLRAHRVVTVRRSGRLAYYRLADGHVRMLLDVALTHLGHSSAARWGAVVQTESRQVGGIATEVSS